ncbi:MAG: hypothetical protein AAF830_09970 [Pseudomonadota bacterium]
MRLTQAFDDITHDSSTEDDGLSVLEPFGEAILDRYVTAYGWFGEVYGRALDEGHMHSLAARVGLDTADLRLTGASAFRWLSLIQRRRSAGAEAKNA